MLQSPVPSPRHSAWVRLQRGMAGRTPMLVHSLCNVPVSRAAWGLSRWRRRSSAQRLPTVPEATVAWTPRPSRRGRGCTGERALRRAEPRVGRGGDVLAVPRRRPSARASPFSNFQLPTSSFRPADCSVGRPFHSAFQPPGLFSDLIVFHLL